VHIEDAIRTHRLGPLPSASMHLAPHNATWVQIIPSEGVHVESRTASAARGARCERCRRELARISEAASIAEAPTLLRFEYDSLLEAEPRRNLNYTLLGRGTDDFVKAGS
jgi:hypothetical protein